jgi:hypothetical protein
MYKIFSVKKGTKAEGLVHQLFNSGFKYIPTFEKEAGIVNFCLDLEVISDGLDDPNLFIVIDGFTENTSFHNDDLQEITTDQFKSLIKRGYAAEAAGTHHILRNLGYVMATFNKYLNEIVLTRI